MKIYYVARTDDDWLGKDTKIYSTEDKAQKEWVEKEGDHWEQWDENRNKARQNWSKKETAFKVLLELGVDAEAIIPYHNRVFKCAEYKPLYVVSSLEVEE